MKNYIKLFCLSLLILSGCGAKKSKDRSNIPFFSDTKKKSKSVKQSSRKTKRALQENLDAFSLEKDNLSENTFSLGDSDMNLFAFDDSKNTTNSAVEENTPLFKWDDLQAEESKDQFKNLYFGFDEYNLKDSESSSLKQDIKLAKQEQCLIQDGDKKIIIEGHSCHSAGSAAYNLALSEKRARSVAKEFIKEGIEKQNIKIAPRGVEMPLVHTGDKVAQARNRRVEVFAIDAAPTKKV